jgi:hypothetical protein
MGCARRAYRAAALLVLGLALGFTGGCRANLGSPVPYAYFATPAADDAWSRKIRNWQDRERETAPSGAPVVELGERTGEVTSPRDLRAKYDSFRDERKRALAREMAEWVQNQAPQHYVPDGAIDHWATLEETFRKGGDDCDGLELLTFHFLLDLGFPEDEVFRAIVVRKRDGQHHMVTLWFEDANDPWVIDPTGAMTSGMPRMSEVPEWVPLKIFTEKQDFTVRRSGLETAQR